MGLYALMYDPVVHSMKLQLLIYIYVVHILLTSISQLKID
jgi:hypothetical protein